MADKHRLDKTATQKLVDAIAVREGMRKDIAKDLEQLDEHLQASNAPSKLVSMKLDSLRKGFPVGHCVYAREPVVGGAAPGVDGVFDKKDKRKAGYSDIDLMKRFSDDTEKIGGGGVLMDEATIKKLMAADREKHDKEVNASSKKKKASKRESRSPSRRGRSRSCSGQRRKRKRSRSVSGKKHKAASKSKRSRSRSNRDRTR